MQEVQEYRDMNSMNIEELKEYISRPYKTKNGIIVTKRYNPTGESLTECWKRYLRRVLE